MKREELKPKVIQIKWWALLLSILVFIAILIMPAPVGLTISGQRALAILALAVILWMTESVSYPVSAIIILALITLLLGYGPSLTDPGKIMGTKNALHFALSGFSSPAVALVTGALFLAAAMQETALDQRLALLILSRVGSSTRGVLIGSIFVGIVLALFIPSPTARVGAIIPIILGMVSAFGLQKESRLAALLIITSAQTASIWSIGFKTASAQNMVALGFIEKSLGITVSWFQWFVAAAPFALIMSILLFFIMRLIISPEIDKIPDGEKMVRAQLKDMGALTGKQIRLLIISLGLLMLWATEEVLHSVDSTTIVLLGVAIMLSPAIGVLSWKQAEKQIPWGTVILFAAGISLGTVLLKTKAATWLANSLFQYFGLNEMSTFLVITILSAFTILIHIGFASATSLSSTLIPMIIALVQGLHLADQTIGIGIILIEQFAIGFGFILPVNAPQNMLAYGSGTFTQKDFMKSGIVLTIIGYVLILVFSLTYWKWIAFI